MPPSASPGSSPGPSRRRARHAGAPPLHRCRADRRLPRPDCRHRGRPRPRSSRSGARAHLVQIFDPIEETFPFSGRTEFRDPETGVRHVVGRAEQYRQDYHDRLAALRERLVPALPPARLDVPRPPHRPAGDRSRCWRSTPASPTASPSAAAAWEDARRERPSLRLRLSAGALRAARAAGDLVADAGHPAAAAHWRCCRRRGSSSRSPARKRSRRGPRGGCFSCGCLLCGGADRRARRPGLPAVGRVRRPARARCSSSSTMAGPRRRTGRERSRPPAASSASPADAGRPVALVATADGAGQPLAPTDSAAVDEAPRRAGAAPLCRRLSRPRCRRSPPPPRPTPSAASPGSPTASAATAPNAFADFLASKSARRSSPMPTPPADLVVAEAAGRRAPTPWPCRSSAATADGPPAASSAPATSRAAPSAMRRSALRPAPRPAEAKFTLPVELRNDIARLEIAGAETAGAVQLLDERWRRRRIGLLSGAIGRYGAAAPLAALLHRARRAALRRRARAARSERRRRHPGADRIRHQRDRHGRHRHAAARHRGAAGELGPRRRDAGPLRRPAPCRGDRRPRPGPAPPRRPRARRQPHLAGAAAAGELFGRQPVRRPDGARRRPRQASGAGGAGRRPCRPHLGGARRRHAARHRGPVRQGLAGPLPRHRRYQLVEPAALRRVRRHAPPHHRLFERRRGEAGQGAARPRRRCRPTASSTATAISSTPAPRRARSPPMRSRSSPAPSIRPASTAPRTASARSTSSTTRPTLRPFDAVALAGATRPRPIRPRRRSSFAPGLFVAALALFAADALAVLLAQWRPGAAPPRRGGHARRRRRRSCTAGGDHRVRADEAADQLRPEGGRRHPSRLCHHRQRRDRRRPASAGLARPVADPRPSAPRSSPATRSASTRRGTSSSFFPLLYWPIDPEAPLPSSATMARIDAYMRQGGSVLFDTRDQLERSTSFGIVHRHAGGRAPPRRCCRASTSRRSSRCRPTTC